ncbi:PleD family two-component system response regulator [Parapedobacter deserti]|uniref:PleD family two-component system response regulator n=1 Tax=Parapedobacter deserti TaxID=1912957 RepID=A0ABV7JTA6_9SPHI
MEKTKEDVVQKKIVIFDDDEDILSICEYVLSREGWDVYAFRESNAIIEKIAQIRPLVIMMDNRISDVGGIEATQQLKQSEYKDIPVIFFSANSDIKQLTETAGADAFLAKPFDLNTLKQVVEDVASKHFGDLTGN